MVELTGGCTANKHGINLQFWLMCVIQRAKSRFGGEINQPHLRTFSKLRHRCSSNEDVSQLEFEKRYVGLHLSGVSDFRQRKQDNR
jgi:hypothetical protein